LKAPTAARVGSRLRKQVSRFGARPAIRDSCWPHHGTTDCFSGGSTAQPRPAPARVPRHRRTKVSNGNNKSISEARSNGRRDVSRFLCSIAIVAVPKGRLARRGPCFGNRVLRMPRRFELRTNSLSEPNRVKRLRTWDRRLLRTCQGKNKRDRFLGFNSQQQAFWWARSGTCLGSRTPTELAAYLGNRWVAWGSQKQMREASRSRRETRHEPTE